MKFVTLSALAAAVPFVNALTIDTPVNWNSGSVVTVNWTNAAGDPSPWSFELINPVFNSAFALANNVNASAGSLTFELGIVPGGDNYVLEAVNVTNINDVFAQTSAFTITNNTVSTTSSASSTSSGASGSSSTAPPSSTTSFGVTVSPSSGAQASNSNSNSGSSSGSSSSSSSGGSPSPSSFNGNGNGALSITNGIASWISMLFATAAGAVIAL